MTIDFTQVVTAEVKAQVAQAAFVEGIRQAVDAHVEATAKGKGYNGAAHCASYAQSTVPDWAAEAAAFIAWRDAVWLAVFSRLAAVMAGQEAPPADAAAVVADLPAMVWPSAQGG